ncbi:histidine kinase N-terminal 7TM domain-containing protein [Halorientalis marina]|uniref:histidine kinase N-terminal 7TM domain-containing protein n=1 Tax=Halorientalis marina TaxID=2931976 RepID=UPI001FF64604|nr:histidine kinase N-terminal 7TM domain-containing protein [Halorientalis marina]
MGWQYTPVTPLLLVSFALSLSLTGFLLFMVDRDGRESVVFGLVGMVAGAAWWSATSLLKLSRTELSVAVLAEQLEYVGATAIVLGWFVFTFAYTDRDEWLTPRVFGGVAGLLLVGTLLGLTNSSHGLLWTGTHRVDAGSFLATQITRQPLFFLFVAVNYLVILAGMYVLARLILGSQQVYRGQAAALVGSAAVPMLVNVTTVLELGPWPPVELSPVAFTVSGALLAFAITRYELLDLEPVARRRVVQHMRDGFVVLDRADRVVDLNPAASDLLDVDPDRAVGRELPDLVPEVEQLVADGGAGTRTEVSFDTDDQQYVQARLTTLDPTDERGGQLLLLQDVTDRREVERRHQRLVEKASDVVFVLDADGTITFASPAIENVLGASPEFVIGEDALDFIHPEDRERIVDIFECGLAEPDETHRFEFRVQAWDGEWHHLEGIGRNLLDDPVVEGIVVNARDITERKEHERQLERQNERLERFASVVSHDLRNPLEVARGHLELAREDGREESLAKVAEAHDRVEDIVENVLTLAREGRHVTETEPVDIETVTREAWRAVETGTATLTVADPPTVAADRDRLRRLLENLLRNAVVHAEEPTVRVGALDGGFFLEDDGPGLPEASDEDLFEFGYTTSDDGTGIGLAIVGDIAEAHGWTVETAESASGGARFEFTGLDAADGAD